MTSSPPSVAVFFFNDPAPPEIYTLSLHDALPISFESWQRGPPGPVRAGRVTDRGRSTRTGRSEEHTFELQSQSNLVCRLLLEKKKQKRPRSRCRRADTR